MGRKQSMSLVELFFESTAPSLIYTIISASLIKEIFRPCVLVSSFCLCWEKRRQQTVIPFLDPKYIRFGETSIKSLSYLPFFLLSLSLLGDFFTTEKLILADLVVEVGHWKRVSGAAGFPTEVRKLFL